MSESLRPEFVISPRPWEHFPRFWFDRDDGGDVAAGSNPHVNKTTRLPTYKGVFEYCTHTAAVFNSHSQPATNRALDLGPGSTCARLRGTKRGSNPRPASKLRSMGWGRQFSLAGSSGLPQGVFLFFLLRAFSESKPLYLMIKPRRHSFRCLFINHTDLSVSRYRRHLVSACFLRLNCPSRAPNTRTATGPIIDRIPCYDVLGTRALGSLARIILQAARSGV
jgi:hypothetical protein